MSDDVTHCCNICNPVQGLKYDLSSSSSHQADNDFYITRFSELARVLFEASNSPPTSYECCLLSCRCGGDKAAPSRQREQPRSLRWDWETRTDGSHIHWTRRLNGKPPSASPELCPGFRAQQTHQSVQRPENTHLCLQMSPSGCCMIHLHINKQQTGCEWLNNPRSCSFMIKPRNSVN